MTGSMLLLEIIVLYMRPSSFWSASSASLSLQVMCPRSRSLSRSARGSPSKSPDLTLSAYSLGRMSMAPYKPLISSVLSAISSSFLLIKGRKSSYVLVLIQLINSLQNKHCRRQLFQDLLNPAPYCQVLSDKPRLLLW